MRLIDADAVAENLMNSCWFDCDDIDIVPILSAIIGGENNEG